MLRPLLLLLCLACCACSPAAEVPGPAAAIPVTSVPASVTARPTNTISPTTTGTSAPAETPAAVPTQTPAPAPAEQCLPLGGYDLEELPEIVSQPFVAPRPGLDDGHHGTDFAHYAYGDKTTIAGAPVQAVFAGVVAAAVANSWPYGNFVIVESRPEQLPPGLADRLALNGRSLYHLYAHLEALLDAPGMGDSVEACDLLGMVGNTGWSGNDHLHLEMRPGPEGAAFSEMAYYQTTTTETERANYERWRFGGEFIPLDPMDVLSR